MAYGFKTYAGFYKAFLREIGYTPSQFLKKYKVKKPYRIHILKAEHIMMPHKKLKEILKYYGLENETLADIIYEETGHINESACYVGTDFVIKYTANLGNVEKHLAISKAMEKEGLSVAALVLTLDGKYYVTDGELYFYVTKRVKGSQLKASTMYLDDYVKKGRYIGEVIGQLDKALLQVDVLADEANIYENVVNWAFPKWKGDLKISNSFFSEYKERFGTLYGLLPKQVIHRDPNPGNIILNGDAWGFVDFELSERNVRIFDPCYAATAILSESFVEEDEEKLSKWVEVYKNIILGYDAVVKLTEVEKQAVPYVLISNQMIASVWFADKEKYEELYHINKKMTEWMINNFSKLVVC